MRIYYYILRFINILGLKITYNKISITYFFYNFNYLLYGF